jgi:hypothetical protein
MDKVQIEELTSWGWECPACDSWNEMDDDPTYKESVICGGCETEFKPDL